MRARAALGVGFGISPPSSEPLDLSRSFQTEQTSWGTYVTSIHGLAASTEDRTYWQFLSAGDALEEGGGGPREVWGLWWGSPCPSLTHPSAAGVGIYKPHAGEHIQAVFSTY